MGGINMYKERNYNNGKSLAIRQPVRIEMDIEYDVSIDDIKDINKKRDAIVEAIRPCVESDMNALRKKFKANIKNWYIL